MNADRVIADTLREWVSDRDHSDLPAAPGEMADRVILALYAAGWRVIRDRAVTPCAPSLPHGVPQPAPLCSCGHRLANHAPPDRHCLRSGCDCHAYGALR